MAVDNLDLYQELLLDHYKNPRHYGVLDNPTFRSEEYNPSCGDKIELYAVVDDSTIRKIGFISEGCIISKAVASILAEKALGISVEQALSWDKDTVLSWLNNIDLGPTRLRCALMALEALQAGLRSC